MLKSGTAGERMRASVVAARTPEDDECSDEYSDDRTEGDGTKTNTFLLLLDGRGRG